MARGSQRGARETGEEIGGSGTPRRGRRIGVRRMVGWAAFLPLASRAPIYGRLFFELIRDERMPAGRKALLAGALGYLVLGRDIIPDDIPVIGGLDDLVVVVLAVDVFLDGVPAELLDEKLDLLGIDKRAFLEDVARIRRFTPGPIRRILRRAPGAFNTAMGAVERSGIGPRVRSFINKEGSIA